MSWLILRFSGANEKPLYNSCNSSQYSRSTSNMYQSELFSPVEFTTNLSFHFLFNHVTPS